MIVHQLSSTEARRIAIRAQLLDSPRPENLLTVIRQLTILQYDGTAAVAPNADLVAWSRLSSSYSTRELAEALADRTLVELGGLIRPSEDISLFRAEMAAWPGDGIGQVADWRDAQSEWVEANEAFRLDILDRIDREGPLTSRELPDTCTVPWRSSGWNNNRNVVMMLGFLELRGEIAAAGRQGRDRLWDLALRVYPDHDIVPAAEALRIRKERRLGSLGIARSRTTGSPLEPLDVHEVGEPAVIEGVKGRWRVDPSQLGRRFAGRAALISPLDRLIFDRKRMVELFEFDYQLEMYKPVAKRRWGYFALPILYGDRFVGKLDATADHQHGVLRVDAIHRDLDFGKSMAAAVDREIKDLAGWLELDLMIAG